MSRTLPGLGDLFHCLKQFAPNIRPCRFAAAFIEPAAILELKVRVEAKELRRAHGIVGMGNILGLVMEVGKRETVLLGEALHVVEGIVWMGAGVVGADGNRVNAETLQSRCVSYEAVDHRFDVGAVVANESNESAVWTFQLLQAVGFAVNACEREAGSLPAKIADRGMLSHSRLLFANLPTPRIEILKERMPRIY